MVIAMKPYMQTPVTLWGHLVVRDKFYTERILEKSFDPCVLLRLALVPQYLGS